MDRQTHLQPADSVRRPPLTQLSFYITNGCNLTCQYCWAGFNPAANEPSENFLTVGRIGAAVREALPLGLQTVRLTGGDPLLHPDIDRLLDRLESLELMVEIETPGWGLTPLRAARLAKMQHSSVLIGINGAEAATHDAIQQMPGAFDAAIQAIKLLSTAGLAPQIVTSVIRSNISQLPAIIHLVESLGAASLRIVMVNNRLSQQLLAGGSNHRTPKEKQEGLAIEELIALGRRVERDLCQTTRLQLIFDQPPVFRGLHSNSRTSGPGHCNILQSLSVLSGGEYGICGSSELIPTLTFGRVGDIPLAQIWNHDLTLHSLRQGMPDRLEGVCGHCVMKAACLGNCAVENYLSTGTLWGPYWFCDAAARSGLFPAGRIIENVW